MGEEMKSQERRAVPKPKKRPVSRAIGKSMACEGQTMREYTLFGPHTNRGWPAAL
jgi:hypothetical protein